MGVFEQLQKKQNQSTGGLFQQLVKPPEPSPNTPRGGLLGLADKTLGRFSKGFTDTYFPGVIDAQNKRMTDLGTTNPIVQRLSTEPEGFLEKGAGIAGTIAGYAAPSGLAYKAISKPAQLGYKALTKGKNLGTKGRIGLEASKGALAGGVISAGETARDEAFVPDQYTVKEHLVRGGINTLAGAALDPLIVVGGPKALGAIKKFFGKDKVKKSELTKVLNDPTTPQEVKQEILMLPEGKTIRQSSPQPKPIQENFIGAKKNDIQTNNSFPIPTKNIPLVRYQKEVGKATHSDIRGGTWYSVPSKHLGENTGYNKPNKMGLGGENKVTERFTPKKPLLIKGKSNAGIDTIEQLKGKEFLDSIDIFDEAQVTKILDDLGLEGYDTQKLFNHPDRMMATYDIIGTELARKAGYDSIVFSTPNGMTSEVVKLSKNLEYPKLPKKLKNPLEPNVFGVSKADQLGVNTRLKDNSINFTMLDKKPLEYVGRMAPMNKVKIQKGTSELTPKLAQSESTPSFNMTSKDTNIDYPFEAGVLNNNSLQANREVAAGLLKKPQSLSAKSAKVNQTQMAKKPIEYTPDNVKTIVKEAVDKIDFAKLKDFSGFKYNSTDIYRNMRDVFKSSYPQVKKMIIDPFNNSKNDFTMMQKDLTKSLKENVVDKLGITKGSKLSKAVQDYGEKKLPLEELKRLHPKDWEKVVEADKYFRQTYDNVLHTINTTRAKIYPNNPEKQIPQRKDYYRHFREMNDIVGLKNIFDSPSAIDPSLVGVSEFTKPSAKFQGFMQKRGLGPYKSDAVGGFLEYIPGASYATHIDPHINVFKKLGSEIAERTASTKNMNNLINYLDKYAKDLAGKTNAADRWLQDNIPGGRKTMGVVRWVNNRVKKNTILGNAASALAQLGNVPNGIAATKQYAVKGAAQSMKDIAKRNEALVNQSPFLNERYVDRSFREFDTRWFEQPMRGAAWMIETADRIGTEFIWNSAYQQALGKKIPNPIDYADDLARRMVAGRGVGEVPILQKSSVFQVLAPFQLEVANAWRVMGDFVKDKDATAIMTLFLSSYIFNKVLEEIRGSGVVFDPIDAIIEASKPGLTPLERGGRLAGEIGSNIPFGQNLAAAYPEYGTEMFGQKLPSREKLFGDEDPTRFGGGLVATKSLTDPLRYGALPFGGNQVSKTYRGAKALVQGGLQKDDKLRFPVESTPSNVAKGLLFGPAGTKEGKEYYKKNMRSLTEKQTLTVKRSSDSKSTYDRIQKRRRMDTINRKMNEVRKDRDLSKKKKDKQLEILRAELKEVRGY